MAKYTMRKYVLVLILFVAIASADLTGDWCGTIPALKDYQDGKLPTRPTLSGTEEIIDRTNFQVHYTRSGRDRVLQSYAESTASYLEYIWTKHIDSLGWAAPPPDGGQGGDDRYDYYITALQSGIAGVTYSENGYSNPYPNGASSHIRISNSLDIIGLAVVVSHEFTHACQFRYSSVEQSWWYENCATWMEDVIYDNSNDYVHYLTSNPNPLSNPEMPITTFSGLYQYAGCVWPMFLHEYYGLNCPRQIWTYQGQISGQNTLSGIDYILTNQYSSNLQTALKKYGLWRYFTGLRADTIHYYKEAYLWPPSRTQVNNLYPVNGNQGAYRPTGPGGANNIQFQNGGGRFFITFDGQDGYQWICHVVGFKPNGNSYTYELPLNASAQGSDSVDWQNYEHFAIVPVVYQTQSTPALTFNYTANIRLLHDVGIIRVAGFPITVDSGAVVNPQVTVKNYGLNNENFPVRLYVGNFYSNTQNLNLNPGDSGIVNFPSCTLRIRNYNAYACSTLLSDDERTTNNSYSDRIFVRVLDIGTVAILEPIGNIAQGSYIRPMARIKNYGNLREIFDIDFSIGSWRATQRFSLAEGLEYDFQFDSVYHATATGNLVVKCSTKLDGDANPNNNRIISSCYVNPVAITDNETSILGHLKIPSIIFNNKVVILSDVSIPNRVELEIFNALGKKIHNEVFENNVICINKPLTAGLYIIRLKLDSEVIVSKSIVIGE
jgi:hypothetical protein